MSLRTLVVTSLLFASASVACGEWFGDCGDQFARRNCWPAPFNYPERYDVRAPFVHMISNGWERQNLLSDPYFEFNGTRLTEAARLKIRWIALEAPRQHRIVYVRRALTPDETAARMNAVHEYLAQLGPACELPQVLESNMSPYGWPAERIDLVGRKFIGAMPTPKLPDAGGSAGGQQAAPQ